MKRLSIACVAALAAALSACSGDDFEAQAEYAVGQQMLTEIQNLEALSGGQKFQDFGVTDINLENFRTSDCNDQLNQRTCKVSFQMSAMVDGEREMDEPVEGEAVFEKREDQWVLISID